MTANQEGEGEAFVVGPLVEELFLRLPLRKKQVWCTDKTTAGVGPSDYYLKNITFMLS